MRTRFGRFAIAAALIFLVLFLIRFIDQLSLHRTHPEDAIGRHESNIGQSAGIFETNRRNYATSKKFDGLAAGPQGQPIGDSQKYEKIGSLAQVSNDYDADRRRFDALIGESGAIVQLERTTGLKGYRTAHLGIGVPPDRFDGFVDKAREIGRNVDIEIVKNDKTTEYLQLKAKRATLEKARTALEELKSGGGSTTERVAVQSRLTEIEQQIQELGVSLGEFDSENELCTVKLQLRERAAPVPASMGRMALRAFQGAIGDYAYLGFGLLCLAAAAWIGLRVVAEARRLIAASAG